LKWRICGSFAAAISCAALLALETVNSMFDCPEQIQTSPTRMSRTNSSSPFEAIDISCGPPAFIAGSVTFQAPAVSAVPS